MYFRKIIWKVFSFYTVLFAFTVEYTYSQNLVKNADFETGSLSPYWVSWPIGTSFATIDINNAFAGEFCAKLESNKVFFYQPVNLEPNTTYKIRATIKTESGDSVFFGVTDIRSAGGDSMFFVDTNYKTDSLLFTTDDSPGNLPNICIWKKDGSGIAWVDNIEMFVQPEVNQPKPPGNFFSTFYVRPSGNDTNTGESPEQAWQTIDKINSTVFRPGDEILFEGGETFNGTIVFNQDDGGGLDSKVHIGSYGTERAIINAQTGSGFIAYDCDNISLKNLNFIGDGRLGGNTGNGITFSYCSNIVIDSVDVSGFQHSGLMVNNIGENYQITNVNAHDNGFSGIFIFGINKTLLSNIYIGYCKAVNNPGDPTVLDNHSGNGIFAFEASDIIIEYCEASYNGEYMPRKGNGPGGIWVAEADSVLIQYCISHHNKTSVGGQDGLGFDFDGGTTNSIIQYCLSYNNYGAGFGIFQYPGATDWKNNTVRYCISENDGNVSAPGSMLFWNGSGNKNEFQNFEFYNNIIYNANGAALAYYDHKNLNFNFRNNIFVSNISGVHNRISGENSQGNCWYSLTGDFYSDSLNFISWAENNSQEMFEGKIVGMYANPMFVNPGSSTLTDPTQLASINDYKITEGSPVIDAGLDLEFHFTVDPGDQDYFGNPIYQGMAYDFGIYQNLNKQIIDFTSGWNIMSLNVMPENKDLMDILQPLIEQDILVKVMDEEGAVIEERESGWVNNINHIESGEGYKIKVSENATLDLTGISTQLPFEIALSSGWNIVSWPSYAEQNGLVAFDELIDGGQLIKVMNEKGEAIEERDGVWYNGIINLIPGEGYKVKVSGDCTLTVHEIVLKSEKIKSETIASTHFIPAYIGNGTDHMNIYLMNVAESGIMVGDEIGVFDGETCVGSVKVSNFNSKEFGASISIPVSAADGIDFKNGYSNGNPITIKLFREGKEYPVLIEPLDNVAPIFKQGSSLFAEIDVKISTGIEGLISSKLADVKCYPNPFSEFVNIEINLQKDSQVEVLVLNQLGQEVKLITSGQTLNNGLHKFVWDGRNSLNQSISRGIYHIRIVIDELVIHKKVVLSN